MKNLLKELLPEVHAVGLNDAGKIYFDPSNEFLECACGGRLPYDPIPNASGYFPNADRMRAHQEGCVAHLTWWTQVRMWCDIKGHFVHKDYMLYINCCERCYEQGE